MVSVIVTAYNMQDYIEECIQSIINQSYKDLEIIIVEDCSTDNTLSIVQNIQDNRIRIIVNDKNMGAGVSRQIGIDNSNGDYIIFIDADDYILEDFIESLYNSAVEENVDFVETKRIQVMLKNGEISYNEKAVFLNKCLVKRDIYNIVKYCPRRYVEDTPTRYHIECVCKKHIIINNDGYVYRYNPNSLTRKSNFIKNTFYEYLMALDVEKLSKLYNKPLPDYIPSKYYLATLVARKVKFTDIEKYLEYVDENTIQLLKTKLKNK